MIVIAPFYIQYRKIFQSRLMCRIARACRNISSLCDDKKISSYAPLRLPLFLSFTLSLIFSHITSGRARRVYVFFRLSLIKLFRLGQRDIFLIYYERLESRATRNERQTSPSWNMRRDPTVFSWKLVKSQPADRRRMNTRSRWIYLGGRWKGGIFRGHTLYRKTCAGIWRARRFPDMS